MSVTKQDIFQDLGTEPDDNRGVALDKPILEDPKPEAQDELEPKQKEVAEGQTEVPDEGQETEGEQPEGASQTKLRAKEFADQAGWTLEEFYRDVTVPTDEGEVTLSEVVDGYKSLRTENETLRQEQQQMAEQANATQPMPQYSPEAMELWRQAKDLQHTYDNADWSQVEASERVDQKMQYRDAIERLTRQGQAKQQEYQVKLDQHMREVKAKVDTEMRKQIPEWRSDSVRTQERKAMTDFLIAEGADQQRVSMILDGDPWAARLVRDYWQLKRNDVETKKAIRKVAKVPRSLTPSARVAPKPGNIADAAKALQGAKNRRDWDKTLASVDLGVSPD